MGCGTNDDVSNSRWAQLEPGRTERPQRGRSHTVQISLSTYAHTLLFSAFIVVTLTTHCVACDIIRSLSTCSTCWMATKKADLTGLHKVQQKSAFAALHCSTYSSVCIVVPTSELVCPSSSWQTSRLDDVPLSSWPPSGWDKTGPGIESPSLPDPTAVA